MKNFIVFLVLVTLLLIVPTASIADTVYEWETIKPTEYKIVLKDNGKVYLKVSLDLFMDILQKTYPHLNKNQVRMNALRAAKIDILNEYIRIRDGEQRFKIGPNTFLIKVSGFVRGMNPERNGDYLELFLGEYHATPGIIHIEWRTHFRSKIRNPNHEIRNNDQNSNAPMTKTSYFQWVRFGHFVI